MTARNNHILPECYLKNFTIDGTKKSMLTGFDLHEHRTFRVVPRKVGGERDFNRIEVPNLPIDALENELAQALDDPAGKAIQNVTSTMEFLGVDRFNIIKLMTFFAVEKWFVGSRPFGMLWRIWHFRVKTSVIRCTSVITKANCRFNY